MKKKSSISMTDKENSGTNRRLNFPMPIGFFHYLKVRASESY